MEQMMECKVVSPCGKYKIHFRYDGASTLQVTLELNTEAKYDFGNEITERDISNNKKETLERNDSLFKSGKATIPEEFSSEEKNVNAVIWECTLHPEHVMELTRAAGVTKTFESFAQMTYMALIGAAKSVSFFVETIDELKQRIVNDIQQQANVCKENDTNCEISVRRQLANQLTQEMINKNDVERCNTEQNMMENTETKDKRVLEMISNTLQNTPTMMTSINMLQGSQINDNVNCKSSDNNNRITKKRQLHSELYLTIDYNVEFTRAIFPIPLLQVSCSNIDANISSENVVHYLNGCSEQQQEHHHCQHSYSNNINGIHKSISKTHLDNNNVDTISNEANNIKEVKDNIHTPIVVETSRKEEEKESMPFAETLEKVSTPEFAQSNQFEGVTRSLNTMSQKINSQENVELKSIVINLHELQQRLVEMEGINEKLLRENEALRRLSKEKMIEMQKLCEVFQSRVDVNTELSRLRSKNTELRLRLEDAETALAEMCSENTKALNLNNTNAAKLRSEQKRNINQQRSTSRSQIKNNNHYMSSSSSSNNNNYSRISGKLTNSNSANVSNAQRNCALHTNKNNSSENSVNNNKRSDRERKIVKQSNLPARSSVEKRKNNDDKNNNANNARVRRVNRFDTPNKLNSSKECRVKRQTSNIAQRSYNQFRTPSANSSNSRSASYRKEKSNYVEREHKIDDDDDDDSDDNDDVNLSKMKNSKYKSSHTQHQRETSHSRQSSLSFQSTQSTQSSLNYARREQRGYYNNNNHDGNNRRRLRRSAPVVRKHGFMCESDTDISNAVLTQRRKGSNRLTSPHREVEYRNVHSRLPFSNVHLHKPLHRSLSSSARSDSSYNRLYSTPTESSRRRAVSPYEVPFATRDRRAVFYENSREPSLELLLNSEKTTTKK